VEETAQRVRNPWGQGERLRVEILEAAARLMSELGGEQGLTIRGVARAAGISPGSIYQHFTDKSELVKGLIEYDYEQLTAAMTKAEEQYPADALLDRIRAQMRAYCRFAINHPGHYRLLISNRPAQPRTGPLFEIVQRVVAMLERCEETGIGLRKPPQRAAVIVFVGAHGRVALEHSRGGVSQDEDILEFVDDLISLVIA
jgi:AcrR family transcriptional regulator